MKRYGLLVVAFLVAALCVRLGFWQLERLEQRRTRNALLETRLAMAPVDLGSDTSSDSLHYRRAAGKGVFDFEREVVVMARSLRGVPGVHIVTPLRLEGGGAVLVERGWVPSPDGKTVVLAELAEPESTLVEGVLLRTQTAAGSSTGSGWPVFVRSPNAAELEARYPYRLRRMIVRRTAKPAGAPAALRAVAVPEVSGGRHLSYAVQWFSFAIIAIVGSLILVRKPMASD